MYLYVFFLGYTFIFYCSILHFRSQFDFLKYFSRFKQVDLFLLNFPSSVIAYRAQVTQALATILVYNTVFVNYMLVDVLNSATCSDDIFEHA